MIWVFRVSVFCSRFVVCKPVVWSFSFSFSHNTLHNAIIFSDIHLLAVRGRWIVWWPVTAETYCMSENIGALWRALWLTVCIILFCICHNGMYKSVFFSRSLNYEYDIRGCHLPKSVNTALLTATCAWALLFPVIYSRFRVCIVRVPVTLPSCRLTSPIIAISGMNLVSACSVCTKCIFAKFYNVKNNTRVMQDGAN